MTERALSAADKTRLIAVWTGVVQTLASWRDVPGAIELSVREVLGEDPGRIPAGLLDSWRPVAVRVTWRARRLTADARVDLQAKAVGAIRRAQTWEAVARGLLRVAATVARAYGGAA